MSINGISERLAQLMGTASRAAFARTCGVPDSSMRQYLEGSVPSADKAAQIAAKTGVSLVWLITGEGEMIPTPTSLETKGFAEEAALYDAVSGLSGFAFVPRLEVAASAGPGSYVEHEDAIGSIAFQAAWLRKRGINPQAARALTVRGDSMEPTIRSGDVLLVDTSKDRVEDNGIYVVVSGGYVQVKRVHPRRDGSLMLISDNQTYPPEDVPANEATTFRVAGRVMWFGRSI